MLSIQWRKYVEAGQKRLSAQVQQAFWGNEHSYLCHVPKVFYTPCRWQIAGISMLEFDMFGPSCAQISCQEALFYISELINCLTLYQWYFHVCHQSGKSIRWAGEEIKYYHTAIIIRSYCNCWTKKHQNFVPWSIAVNLPQYLKLLYKSWQEANQNLVKRSSITTLLQ